MGFETTRFVERDYFDAVQLDVHKCSICLKILQDPVLVRACEHAFCRNCIMCWMRIEMSCPEDRTPIKRTDVIEFDRFLLKLYGRMKIKCDFAEVKKVLKLIVYKTNDYVLMFVIQYIPFKDGCEAVVPLGEFENHLLRCQHNRRVCPRDCGFGEVGDQLSSHDCVRYLKQKLSETTSNNAANWQVAVSGMLPFLVAATFVLILYLKS